MIYLLIANEAALQEHKRGIFKRAQPPLLGIDSSFLDFQFTRDFFGKLGYSRKNSRSVGGGEGGRVRIYFSANLYDTYWKFQD